MALPIAIEDLLTASTVESSRIEFKPHLNDVILPQIIKSICAFANDWDNQNGGYLVIGVEEDSGRAVFPIKGLAPEEIEATQKRIRTGCNRLIPQYQPLLSPETLDGRHLLVVWVPPSNLRPHTAPDGDDHKYFVRIGAETVKVERGPLLDQLMEQTAKVPFDDRRNLQATLEDIRESHVREYVRNIDSELVHENRQLFLYRGLRISEKVNGHDAPKNIGLLMFAEDPQAWFPSAEIEVVHFAASGDVQEEKVFRGGLHHQLRNALNHLDTIGTSHLEKQSGVQARLFVNYPIPALREAVVNAICHRSYEFPPEPIKVYFYIDRIEIWSYPGPVPGITEAHLRLETPMPQAPARNRRVADFMKSLRLAERRGTGLKKMYRVMEENGSPPPTFEFDEERTYFKVTLPAHPEYLAVSILREAAHLRALGRDDQALNMIRAAWATREDSPTLAKELIASLAAQDRITEAMEVLAKLKRNAAPHVVPPVTLMLIEILLNAARETEAQELLAELPSYLVSSEAIEAAIAARRAKRPETAHRYFERAGDALLGDPRALLEFAQCKLQLSKGTGSVVQRRFLTEARELLERALQLEADQVRHAWVWRELARVRKYLGLPRQEVEDAYRKAVELFPKEPRFAAELQRFLETG